MKPTNQNFGSNFSNDNMTESVKLADFAGSDHEANTRKQFMKYAQGGRDQYDVSEEKEKNDTKFQMPDIKPIKTEQSQVSGIDSGFKKIKATQGDLLKQLRDQFNMIKKIPANENRQEEKLSSSSSQSDRSGPHEDPSSSSISSSKINKVKAANMNQRQQRLWMVERKQYEFMLNNCQQKIEQLLHNEMEYKKIIHELKSSILTFKPTSTENKYEAELKELQKQLKEQKQKNFKLTAQLEKIKIVSKQQIEKITKFQSQFSYKSKDESKLNDEKRRLEENIRLEKDRFLNCEIERRKFQMENELLIKQKEQQVNRVQRQLEHQNIVNELNIKSLIKKFQDEIEIKDRRYMLLVSEYEKLKKQYAVTKAEAEKPQPDNTNNQFFEIFKKLIEDKKKNNPTEELARTVRDLFDKLNEKRQEERPQYQYPQRHEEEQNEERHAYTEKLLSQIRILKAEIEAFKNSGEGIDLQPMKRMYEAEIAALKDTISILQRKLKNVPSTPPSKEENPNSPLRRDRQVNQLQRRIRELEESSKLKPETSFSFEQHEQIVVKHKTKIEQIQAELRTERRRKSQAQFQLSKLRKELQFRTNIIVNEKQSLLRIKQSQVDRANNNINYWRSQFENMRAFYEQKLAEKNRLLEQNLNTTDLTQIRKKYEEGLDNARLEYEKQVKAIAQRLSNYKTQSLEYDALLKRFTALETAYFELQKTLFKAKQTNDGIDHLWQIKQTEYGNINEILRQVYGTRRGGPQFIPSGGGSSIDNAIYNAMVLQGGNSLVQPNRQSTQPQPQSQIYPGASGPATNEQFQQGIYTGFNQLLARSQAQRNLNRSNSLQMNNNLGTSAGIAGSQQISPQYMSTAPIRTSYEVAPTLGQGQGAASYINDLNARNTVYSNDPRMSQNTGFGQTVTYQPRISTNVATPQSPAYDPRISTNTNTLSVQPQPQPQQTYDPRISTNTTSVLQQQQQQQQQQATYGRNSTATSGVYAYGDDNSSLGNNGYGGGVLGDPRGSVRASGNYLDAAYSANRISNPVYT